MSTGEIYLNSLYSKQEHNHNNSSSAIDDQTMHEIYSDSQPFLKSSSRSSFYDSLPWSVIYQFSLSAHLCCAPTLLWFLLWFSLLFHPFYSYLNSILRFTLWIILIFLSYSCPYSDICTIWLFSYLRYYDTSLLCFRLSHSVLSPNFYLTNCKVLLRLQFVN